MELKLLGLGLGALVGYISGMMFLIPITMLVGWEIASFLSEKEIDGEKISYGTPGDNGSFPNYKRTLANSIRWTKASTVMQRFSSKKESFYINNFQYTDKRIKHNFSFFASFLSKKIEKKDLMFPWESLKKGSLIVGSMGQGKTVFMLNIMEQFAKTKRRMVIHDTKGEFTEYFYRPEKDFIINHLEERGVYWDFFEDNEKGLPVSLILDFFHAYFLATSGDKGDQFWTTMAALRFEEIFNEIKTSQTIASNEKMETFIIAVLRYFDEVKKGNDKTEQSIATTLQSSFDIFVKMLYMKKNASKGAFKSFSFIEFFNIKYEDGTPNDSRIFLHTIEEVSRENIPFVVAFLSLLFKLQLSQVSVEKEQYILYPLDEYLTFFSLLDADLKKSLHTKARSTGGLLLPAIQYLPQEEQDRKNLLSSVENMFLFAITDTETQKNLGEFFGKTKITRIQKGSSPKEKPTSQEVEMEFIEDNIVKMLKTGNHISYMPKDKGTLYVGYTKYPSVPKIQEGYIRQGRDVENDFIHFKQNLLPEKDASTDTKPERKNIPDLLFLAIEEQYIKVGLENGFSAGEGKNIMLFTTPKEAKSKVNSDAKLLGIYTSEMQKDGYVFKLYQNDTWVTKELPSKYIELI